ncbi:MAG: methyltransferase domain-containing protein [Nitrospira sp.]|nr:methyltransferase domain-containing protein [Nitrospira sp.]
MPSSATSEDRWLFTQSHLASIVACLECGLLYRNPRPRPEAMMRAYQTERYDGAYLEAAFTAQRYWFRPKAALLLNHLAARATGAFRILEIGSFVGGFLAEGRALGWDMLGLDTGRMPADFCRRQGLPIVQGTVEDAGLSPNSFDAITIWNRFDQLSDPQTLLRSVVPLLRRRGLLVIRIPNAACFEWAMTLRAKLSKRWRRPLDAALAWNNLLTFPYLYGYSPVLLTGLVESFGLALRACHPDTSPFVPAGHLKWWARLEERVVKGCCRTARAVSWQPAGEDFHHAPWLDVYFERERNDA